MRIYTVPLLPILLLSLAGLNQASGETGTEIQQYGIEVYGAVVKIVDGDTIDVRIFSVYKDRYSSLNGTVIRVRLADINAPELGTPEGEEAKRVLASILSGKYVYLDIDDLYIYDRYGRIVAIVYLPINTTHLLNINLWLVQKGYARAIDYPNEFNPSTWKLYIVLRSNESLEDRGSEIYTIYIALVVIVAALITAIMVYLLKLRRSSVAR
ncbi:MAG: thermonuclease family protein [Desulfurococcales archaeon]|nr:thermonuclease family protein [Desulfurococcales archaeon]